MQGPRGSEPRASTRVSDVGDCANETCVPETEWSSWRSSRSSDWLRSPTLPTASSPGEGSFGALALPPQAGPDSATPIVLAICLRFRTVTARRNCSSVPRHPRSLTRRRSLFCLIQAKSRSTRHLSRIDVAKVSLSCRAFALSQTGSKGLQLIFRRLPEVQARRIAQPRSGVAPFSRTGFGSGRACLGTVGLMGGLELGR